MLDRWTTTVAGLAGTVPSPPSHWPEARTRRVDLWDHPMPKPDAGPLSDLDRMLLRTVLDEPLTGGEIAYRLGIELECAYARVSRLRARGLLAKHGKGWLCSDAGRGALSELMHSNGNASIRAPAVWS